MAVFPPVKTVGAFYPSHLTLTLIEYCLFFSFLLFRKKKKKTFPWGQEQSDKLIKWISVEVSNLKTFGATRFFMGDNLAIYHVISG